MISIVDVIIFLIHEFIIYSRKINKLLKFDSIFIGVNSPNRTSHLGSLVVEDLYFLLLYIKDLKWIFRVCLEEEKMIFLKNNFSILRHLVKQREKIIFRGKPFYPIWRKLFSFENAGKIIFHAQFSLSNFISRSIFF